MRPIDADTLVECIRVLLCDDFADADAGTRKVVDVPLRKYINGIPTLDVVPIDDLFGEMINWAVRYALGRRSYSVSDTVHYVLPLVPRLDDRTLWVIEQDIMDRAKIREGLGDDMDERQWRKLLGVVVAENERRSREGEHR